MCQPAEALMKPRSRADDFTERARRREGGNNSVIG